MDEDVKKRLCEFIEASQVIADYLKQQVRTGAIKQDLYIKQIQRYVIALNETKADENEWK